MIERLCLIPIAFLAAGCVGKAWPEADLILTNGTVYTLSWEDPDGEGIPAANAPYRDGTWNPDAEAIVLGNGTIIYVGEDDEALRYVGPETEVIDVRGATILPGAVESHGHVHELGEHHEQLDLTTVGTLETMIDLVAGRAAEVPVGEWIVGWGWDEGAWADNLPDWKVLSERVPDHPVVLKGRRGFGALGNRLAFDLTGISESTPDPDGGEIVRDSLGHFTGVLLNNALDILYDRIPERTLDQKKRILSYGLDELASSGYVAAHHAGVRSDYMPAYEALRLENDLPIRTHLMLAVVADNRPLIDTWLERGPTRDAGDMLQVRAVKAYYDASLGSRGARMLEDYSDMPGHRGVSGKEYGFDEEMVARLMEKGFQAGVHAIGDEGNRHVLDFYENVFTRSPVTRENRHRIEHAQVIHPDDFGRLRGLNVTASMEPGHAVEDSPWAEDRVGPERIKGAYAWRTLRRNGALLIFNADYSGTDHSLFYGLYCAITRQNRRGEPAGGWYPGERLTPEEATRAYTSWTARATLLEVETGTLEEGKWADITVMDIDPLNVDPDDARQLLRGEIYLTIVGGRIVHRNLPWEAPRAGG